MLYKKGAIHLCTETANGERRYKTFYTSDSKHPGLLMGHAKDLSLSSLPPPTRVHYVVSEKEGNDWVLSIGVNTCCLLVDRIETSSSLEHRYSRFFFFFFFFFFGFFLRNVK